MARKARTKQLRGMTRMMRDFAQHYVECGVFAEAARRAGYGEKNAGKTGWVLSRNPIVVALISEKLARIEQDAEVDRRWLLIQAKTQYLKADASAGMGKTSRPVERGHALRSLELIGKHVDVQAFREQVGVGNPDGSNIDYSVFSDEELATLESLLAKANRTAPPDPDLGGDTGGTGAPTA